MSVVLSRPERMWNYCMMALTEQILVLGFSKNTANEERPAGPNIRGFSLMNFFHWNTFAVSCSRPWPVCTVS